VVLLERDVLSRTSRSDSTKRVLDSSQSGFDSTKSGCDLDERSADEGNRVSDKSQGRLVFQERLVVHEKTFAVFEE
jgi:hypothetical protein